MNPSGIAQEILDRGTQVAFAQARGAVRNGDLLRQAVARALSIEAARKGEVRDMDDALVGALTAVVEALEAVGAKYAVTGSIASSVHGEPFASLDVDLIVIASAGEAAKVAASLGPRFYAPADMLSAAAERNEFANVVDNASGLKVDLSFVAGTGYLAEALARRVRSRIGSSGPEFWFTTPEDVILMKLLWRRETRSAKQWENALSVARVRGTRMDWKYLFAKAEELGVEGDLTKLRDEAGI